MSVNINIDVIIILFWKVLFLVIVLSSLLINLNIIIQHIWIRDGIIQYRFGNIIINIKDLDQFNWKLNIEFGSNDENKLFIIFNF